LADPLPEHSFDRVADEYERARPDYPPEVLDPLPLGRDSDVLDVGAGTGKLTRVLVRRYRHVTAVEPLANMRAILERVVPEAIALAGSAEQIPLDDASVDAIFAAQAFHWFDKARALPEFVRVLRPGGVLALVWNSADDGRPDPLPAAFRARIEELHRPGWDRFSDLEKPWEEVLEESGLFADVSERTSVPHEHVLDRQGILDNTRSVSWVASRPDAEEVIAGLAEHLPEGSYPIPNLANLLWARRR
jgi:SAM-dependent methyltransferase